MNPRLAHLLVRLYPHPWRERYGVEFEALLQTACGGLRASANVVPSVSLHVVEITFSRGFEFYLRSHSFNGLVHLTSWAC
jgi:hypothetical protein